MLERCGVKLSEFIDESVEEVVAGLRKKFSGDLTEGELNRLEASLRREFARVRGQVRRHIQEQAL